MLSAGVPRRAVNWPGGSRAGSTPLQLACGVGNAGLVRMLLQEFGEVMDLNAVDAKGRTALDVCVKNAPRQLSRQLWQWGARRAEHIGSDAF